MARNPCAYPSGTSPTRGMLSRVSARGRSSRACARTLDTRSALHRMHASNRGYGCSQLRGTASSYRKGRERRRK